jgi:hypothetical protein
MVAQARVQARRRGEPGPGLSETQPGSDRDGTVTAPRRARARPVRDSAW